MAALVQTLPQQTNMAMLQTRPSTSGSYSPSHPQQHQMSRSPQMPRYNAPLSSGTYRGPSSYGPVAPYAFTSTPHLANSSNQSRQVQTPYLRPENRTSSAPVIPGGSSLSPRQRYSTHSSMSTSTSSIVSLPPQQSLEDVTLNSRPALAELANRPPSTVGLLPAGSDSLTNSFPAGKPTPDRYRRNPRREINGSPADSVPNRSHHNSALPSGSGMATVGHLYNHSGQVSSTPLLQNHQSLRGLAYDVGHQARRPSADDMNLNRAQTPELAKRYRRRSIGSLETAGLKQLEDSLNVSSSHPNTSGQSYGTRGDARERREAHEPHHPVLAHTHKTSSESVSTKTSSRPSSSRKESGSMSAQQQVPPLSKQEIKLVNIPPRTSDANKRLTSPSPLSNPMTMSTEAAVLDGEDANQDKASTAPMVPIAQSSKAASPAAQQLAAVSQKDEKKSKSKLRRAFSFGSASELRRATAQNHIKNNVFEERSAKRSSKNEHEMDPEQAKIAQKQEAGGLGESIYSGQGHFSTGSTDNLSISSTASSASLMLRKMGKGVKKSTRSLVGLFRPKSVVGVPAADGPVIQASVAQVSMITVEAEREKVNVNLDPHDQVKGGTGFPHLERNSIDARTSADGERMSNDALSRRSIVGGESERVEVLAAVKKSILKRPDSGQSSPTIKPLDLKAGDFILPQIPHVYDSPHSSAPSTPADDQPPRSGHRRTDSIAIEGLESEDYFASIANFAAGSKIMPLTPHSTLARNISFSPRIQFHDTWPSGEYDRRGEIATCNRLTPMLAQQIKEELNTFKMEMEVHENSKVYTHFF